MLQWTPKIMRKTNAQQNILWAFLTMPVLLEVFNKCAVHWLYVICVVVFMSLFQTEQWHWIQARHSNTSHVDWILDFPLELSLYFAWSLAGVHCHFLLRLWTFFFLSAAVRFGIGDEKKLKEKEQQWERTEHLWPCCGTTLPAVCWQPVDKSL